MDNPIFVSEEDIPMLQDEDYHDYRTPDTSRVEISFIEPTDAIEPTSTLRLRQKLKRDELVSLYRYLSVTVNPGLADLDKFMIKKIQKQVTLICFFSMLINIGNLLPTRALVKF